jgi:carbohydrate kinase (thermoresistant glucokinase family)
VNAVIIVLTGPSGAGKTTIGQALAAALGWPFIEGDEFHTPGNLDKIRRGVPLIDRDRGPWLERLHQAIGARVDRRESAVLACSALKQRYRATLRGSLRGIRFVALLAPEPVLRARLETRPGHLAGPEILPSQLADLEVSDDAVVMDATRDQSELIRQIRDEFGL